MDNSKNLDKLVGELSILFQQVIGINEISHYSVETDLVNELKIDSDDLSYFIHAIETKYNIDISPDKWSMVNSIKGIAELVLKNTSNGYIGS